MDCFVYVLGTRTKARHLTYVGWTSDVARRLAQHNSGKGARTTRGRVWVLLHSEWFSDAARSHEPRVALEARPRVPEKAGAQAQERTRPMSIFKEPKIDCHVHVLRSAPFSVRQRHRLQAVRPGDRHAAAVRHRHEDLRRQPRAAGAAEFRLRQRQFLYARHHRARQRPLQGRRHRRLRRRSCGLARFEGARNRRCGLQPDLPRQRLLQAVRRPDRQARRARHVPANPERARPAVDVRAVDRSHAGARADRPLRTADAGGGPAATRLPGAAAARRAPGASASSCPAIRNSRKCLTRSRTPGRLCAPLSMPSRSTIACGRRIGRSCARRNGRITARWSNWPNCCFPIRAERRKLFCDTARRLFGFGDGARLRSAVIAFSDPCGLMPANLITLAHLSVSVGDELAEVGRRSRHRRHAQIGKPRRSFWGRPRPH